MVGYAAASRSVEGGNKAFKQATKFLVGNMLRSVMKKLEIEMLYGQIGYATLAVSAAFQFLTGGVIKSSMCKMCLPITLHLGGTVYTMAKRPEQELLFITW